MMTVLCIAVCAGILLVVLGCAFFVLLPAHRSLTPLQRVLGAVLSLVVAVFLLRPHEHVFQGLDSSGYRLMCQALAAGRPLVGVDKTLLEIPDELRVHTLLLPHMNERNTRDRSFEITNLQKGTYEPFFYPLLPMAMYGLDLLVPGPAADYFVPVVGSIFVGVLMLWGISRMGLVAGVAVPALLLVSPLPAWLLRGCYVESISGVLLGLALLAWFETGGRGGVTPWVFAALGLAVSFHPVMMIPALCLAGPMLMTEPSLRRLPGLVAMGVVGVLPLVVQTVWICQPYGSISWDNIRHGMTVSMSIRATLVGAGLAGVIMMVALLFRKPLLLRLRVAGWRGVPLSILLLALALGPTLLAATLWREHKLVEQGIRELVSGLQVHGTLVFIALAVCALLRRRQSAVGVLAVGLSLPVFLYLKGAEQMGLWSQRRLIAPYLLFVVAIFPTVCWLGGWWLRPGRIRWLRVLVLVVGWIGLGVGGGIANYDKWVAPYSLRFEEGADAWTTTTRAAMGGRLTLSDSYGHSLPLAVDGRTRIVAFGEKTLEVLPDIMRWAAPQAAEEELLWLTPHLCPGMEAGVVFEAFQPPVTQVLIRARAKWALPAVCERIAFQTQLFRVLPVDPLAAPPVMDKIMDAGVLGLREPWGRSDIPIRLPGGYNLPARWSREGSGIVGPVPPPGGSVKITVKAVSGRIDDVKVQTLRFHPPWAGGEPAIFAVQRQYATLEGIVQRPLEANVADATNTTGIYRLHASHPYNPATVKIQNFDRDLGALIHRIRIEMVEPPRNGP